MPTPSIWSKVKEYVPGVAQVLAAFNIIRENVPILEDEVIVEVLGQPGASKKTLYYLALAVANTLVRKYADLLQINPGLPPTFGLIMIEYDASDNWVRAILRYQSNPISAAISKNKLPGTRSIAAVPNIPVYAGPDCDVVGYFFDFRSDILPGIPGGTGSDNPILPFAGRTILTPCPTVREPIPGPNPVQPPNTPIISSPNPKPPGDNRSRGMVVGKSTTASLGTKGATSVEGARDLTECCDFSAKLVPLVMAALTNPGSLDKEQFKGPIQGPSRS